MRTPAQIAGHPIHPMLVTLPIGLWLSSLVCDIIARVSDSPEAWASAAYFAMVGGIIGALAAALPGLIDLLSLRDKPIRSTALKHMGLNLIVVALYIVNAWMRRDDGGAPAEGTTLLLSVIAILLLSISGWLGGKMVYEAGVGVHTEELGEAATREGWSSERAGSARGSMPAAGLRSDHAFASTSARESRELRREDRPAAGRACDNPRE